jgi:RES domain-containing protein
MILWRISNHVDLSGKGGMLAPGRWHRQGFPIVYCCDHPSTALLEILVHLDLEDLPSDFQLLKIACPEDVSLGEVEIGDIDLADPEMVRDFGTDWLSKKRSCLLKVPSVILPEAANVLINPQHADASRVKIEITKRYPFDSRLLR